MNNRIKEVAKAVLAMEQYLNENLVDENGNLQKKKLWKNTYIKKQIEKRKNGGTFILEDHIRAMVYSMLSAGIAWERIEKYIDNDTSQITAIDEVFQQYNYELLLQSDPSDLRDKIKGLHCATQYTYKQMKALVDVNIKKLIEIETQYGSIDKVYEQLKGADESLKTLILSLANPHSKFKLEQMGEALVAEYLKNVGYDIAKPDRHIQRILGSEILGCSDKKEIPVYEAFDIVSEIAAELRKSVAEVDFILWSYCANGYGEICTVNKPKCDKCVVNKYCEKKKED